MVLIVPDPLNKTSCLHPPDNGGPDGLPLSLCAFVMLIKADKESEGTWPSVLLLDYMISIRVAARQMEGHSRVSSEQERGNGFVSISVLVPGAGLCESQGERHHSSHGFDPLSVVTCFDSFGLIAWLLRSCQLWAEKSAGASVASACSGEITWLLLLLTQCSFVSWAASQSVILRPLCKQQF